MCSVSLSLPEPRRGGGSIREKKTMPSTRSHPRMPPPPAARPRSALHGTEIGHAGRQPVDGSGDALLPHDRDEAVGATAGEPSPPMQQAHRDLQRGLRDTDRGAVTDRVYRQLKDGPEGLDGRPASRSDAAGLRRDAPAAREGDHHGRGQRER